MMLTTDIIRWKSTCLPHIFAQALTVCEKLICENVGQGHEGEKNTHAVRSQMFEYVLLILFIILVSANIRKRMYFTYFKHLKSKM